MKHTAKVRGEGLPNKNPVILDRRRNKIQPLVIIDQREDVMFFDGPQGDMMMGNQGAILDEAGNPMMGMPTSMAFADMNGDGGPHQISGMPEPIPTPGNIPRSNYLRRKPLRVFSAMEGDDSITIGHPSSDTASTTSSLSDYSSDNPYPPQPQYHSNLAPIPEHRAPYEQMEPMGNNGNRRVRFDEAPPRQHVYEPEQSDDDGGYDEPYEPQYLPAQGGGMPQPNWNYPLEQDNSMRMMQPQPMPQQAGFDPSWNRPVIWGDEPQQLPNGNWPMPKPRWRLHHAEV
jgi:hypothetical protein